MLLLMLKNILTQLILGIHSSRFLYYFPPYCFLLNILKIFRAAESLSRPQFDILHKDRRTEYQRAKRSCNADR